MADTVVRAFAPRKVILFGSRAGGDARPDSDVDLLVVFEQGESELERCVQISRTLTRAPDAKDMLVTTPSEIALRGHVTGTALREALREDVVVYERS